MYRQEYCVMQQWPTTAATAHTLPFVISLSTTQLPPNTVLQHRQETSLHTVCVYNFSYLIYRINVTIKCDNDSQI